nr:hypothetical protein [Gemmatimonadota bacterium]NIU75095.1 hypothetical protein [Gammaproteobacteria bacterium]
MARAAEHELSADETVMLFLQNEELNARRDAIEAIANLWIDYTLLATAAMEDTTLSHIDLQPVVAPNVERTVFEGLRAAVIGADTVLTDEE